MIAELVVPLAHAGHILADAAIFGVPVGSVVLTIWGLNKWGPKDPDETGKKKRAS